MHESPLSFKISPPIPAQSLTVSWPGLVWCLPEVNQAVYHEAPSESEASRGGGHGLSMQMLLCIQSLPW